ncbi:hypothetical protein ACFQZQ_02825 [Lysobacter koreensis]|uniref:DUF637 domain-containing protein n=1 Tax=Lysobacter koreensis TaxID=266122 RepID=A0ABW2YM65_9GAMM
MLDALQRRSITSNAIAATGPGTAADTLRGGLQSPLAQRGITGVAATVGGLLGNVPGSLAAVLASEGAIAANNAVTRKVGQKAASAPLAAEAIEAHNRRMLQRKQGLLGQYGMPEYLLPFTD